MRVRTYGAVQIAFVCMCVLRYMKNCGTLCRVIDRVAPQPDVGRGVWLKGFFLFYSLISFTLLFFIGAFPAAPISGLPSAS